MDFSKFEKHDDEIFDKHANSSITLICKQMKKYIKIYRIELYDKKIIVDGSIDYFLNVVFDLDQQKGAQLNIEYDQPDVVKFRGHRFTCPQHLDSLFQAIEEQLRPKNQ